MVFLGLEQPVAYGRQLVFDPTTAQMVLNANRDYINAVYNDYQQARQDMKDFLKEYGDFLSPILADMDWYELNVTGNIRDFVNDLYARGIDPLRSQEGRALISMKLANMPTGKIAMLRLSAKDRMEYDKTVAQMMANGTYNEDFERWRFAKEHGGLLPENWDTMKNGLWGTRSAAAYQDLNAATKHWYDLIEDSYLGTKDGYDYIGKSLEDVRKVMQTHLPDLTSDYWQYLKELARRLAGPLATDSEIQLVFENNLMSAAAEVYSSPKRVENAESKRLKEHAIKSQEMRENAALKYYYDMAQLGVDINDPAQVAQYQQQMRDAREAAAAANRAKASKYSSMKPGNDSYKVTEEIHHDGLFNQIKNMGIPVTKLTIDKDGNIKPAVDSKGNPIMIPAYQATQEELEYAASNKNNLIRYHIRYMDNLRKKYNNQKGSTYLSNPEAQHDFENTYGYNTRGGAALQFWTNKKVEDNGAISLNRSDLDKMLSLRSIMTMSYGSRWKLNDDVRKRDVFGVPADEDENDAMEEYNKPNGNIQALWIFNETHPKNTIQVPVKDKSGKNGAYTEVFFRGTARILVGDEIIEVEQWMPAGLISNKTAISNNRIKASDMSLNDANRAAYADIDAGYAKYTGSQKLNNTSLYQ